MRFHKIFGAEQLWKFLFLFISAKTFPTKKNIKKKETFCGELQKAFVICCWIFVSPCVKALMIYNTREQVL